MRGSIALLSVRKRVLLAGGALLLVGIGAVAAFVVYREGQGASIRGSSTVEFNTTLATTPTPAPTGPARRKPDPIPWPTFGYDDARLHTVSVALRPPFRTQWRAPGRSLLEFPPAVGYGRLYLANGRGVLFALNARTGRRVWSFSSGRCVAASPAVSTLDGGTVFETFLNRMPCDAKRPSDGEVVALSAQTGSVRWQKHIGASETSPLVAGGKVFVGDWLGNVYSLDAATGRTRWIFHAGGEIKGAVALAGGRLYFGSYDGHVYSLAAGTGRLLWRASGQPRLFGNGTFYSTPAVAYERVYIGSTDGKVYSFGAVSGKIRFSHTTGGYVYGSPAIWHGLVLVGSYDHNFYALDAATGDERWRFQANGPISGSATVLAGVVYFATLRGRTYGLSAATGRLLWSFPDGKYTPIVADRHRLYLTGFGKVYALTPR